MRTTKSWWEWDQKFKEAQANFERASLANDDDQLLVWSLRIIALEDERLGANLLKSKRQIENLICIQMYNANIELEFADSSLSTLQSTQQTEVSNYLAEASARLESIRLNSLNQE